MEVKGSGHSNEGLPRVLNLYNSAMLKYIDDGEMRKTMLSERSNSGYLLLLQKQSVLTQQPFNDMLCCCGSGIWAGLR